MTAAIPPDTALRHYIRNLPGDATSGRAVWITPDGRVAGQFMQCSLASVFQPVRRLNGGDTIGHEAFIRSIDISGCDLSPWNPFAHAASDPALIELDRLCRTVHVLNYFSHADDADSLFVNVHGRLMLAVGEDHGNAFGRVLSALKIERRRVAVESPEAMASDLATLAYVMLNYRYNGYRIGVNLQHAGQLDDLIRHVRPDFVKLEAERGDTLRTLADAAAKCTQNGIQLTVKRIGTASTLGTVRAAGVPLGQGHALGHAITSPN